MTPAGDSKSNDQVIDLSSPRQWKAISSPMRMGILEVITSSGGATTRELSDLLGKSPSLVHYHVGILEESGILKSVRSKGKPGRVHVTTGRRLVIVHNRKSKTQSNRAQQLAAMRIGHSMKIVQAHAGDSKSRAFAHWESLTQSEHKEVQKHFDQVDRILSRARRRRRRQGLEAQRATSHVVFAVEEVKEAMPPTPRIDLRDRP